MLRSIVAVVSLSLFAVGVAGSAAEPAGVYTAEIIEESPSMAAGGMVWWKDRLIIADRGGKRLVAHTPPDKFETLREGPVPCGLATDPDGNLVVIERDPNRIVCMKADGTSSVIAEEDVGTPQFVTVHKSGRVCWSGFPSGGTRSIMPGGTVEVHSPKIGHTYGIGLSPKQDWLYVSSKLPNADGRAVWRFPCGEDGKVGEGEVFFKTPDPKPQLENLPPANDGKESLLG
jgi:sugar lactone lactonase YvrE